MTEKRKPMSDYTIQELAIFASAYAHTRAHPAYQAVMSRIDELPIGQLADEAEGYFGDRKLTRTFEAIGYSDASWQKLRDSDAIYSPREMLDRAEVIRRAHGDDMKPAVGHLYGSTWAR